MIDRFRHLAGGTIPDWPGYVVIEDDGLFYGMTVSSGITCRTAGKNTSDEAVAALPEMILRPTAWGLIPGILERDLAADRTPGFN